MSLICILHSHKVSWNTHFCLSFLWFHCWKPEAPGRGSKHCSEHNVCFVLPLLVEWTVSICVVFHSSSRAPDLFQFCGQINSQPSDATHTPPTAKKGLPEQLVWSTQLRITQAFWRITLPWSPSELCSDLYPCEAPITLPVPPHTTQPNA